MRMWKIGAAVAAAWLLTGAVVADDLAAVEKAVQEAYGKVKSVRAKIVGETNMENPSFSLKGASTGSYEFARQGGKYYARTETKDSSETTMAGQSNKTEGSTLTVCDGEWIWSLSDQMGTKTATKMKVQKDIDRDSFQQLKESHSLKLLPEEKVNGADCYVIEATPKDPSQAAMSGRMVQYITKQHGFSVKTVGYTPDNKPMFTMTFTDIEFDVDIAPDRFKFEAPEGVTVQEVAMPAEGGEGETANP